MFKDFAEFFDERVKSPFYSYIAFSFLVANWKALFYLIFADTSISARLVYFDMKTSIVTLLFLPLLLGVIGALFAPYLSHWGAWWAEKPTKEKKMRQVKVAVDIRQARADLENAVNMQVDAAIKSAMQDKEIARLDDVQLQEKVKEEVAKIRKEIEPKSVIKTENEPKSILSTNLLKTSGLSEEAVNILSEACKDNKGQISKYGEWNKGVIYTNSKNLLESVSAKKKILYEDAFNDLVLKKYLEDNPQNFEDYRVTKKGYELIDSM